MKILIYRKSALIGTHGGIEKIVSSFANAFAARGHEVVIMTRDKRKGSLFFPVCPQIRLLNLHDEVQKNWGIFRQIGYKILRRRKNAVALLQKFPFFDREKAAADIVSAEVCKINPDIILSCGIADSVDLLHGQQNKIPLIQMFHSLPSVYFHAKNKVTRGNISQALKKISLAQVLLPSFVKDLQKYYNGKITVIGNPVELTDKNISYAAKDQYRIIYMARLDQHKQQDLLIRAFALLAQQYPQWEVNLWGSAEKSKLQELQKLISELKLEKQVFLRGITAEAQKELLKSDICAFPSAFEGFGLALSEAMAVGLPCVGLKTASAVNELIVDNINGCLADGTPEDFAAKLRILMDSPETRQRFGLAGKEMMKKYNPEIIWNKWEELIKETIEKHHA